jgi:glutathione S-transferase
MEPSKPILNYFDMHARGETIRFLFYLAKVDYVDNRISKADWPALKTSGKFEFSFLPMVEIDGHQLSFQSTILRYLGGKYGFYPEDVYYRYLIDSGMEAIKDFFDAFPYVIMFMTPTATEEEKNKAFMEFVAKLGPLFKILENRLKDNVSQEFFVGDKWSIVDIFFFGLYWCMLCQPNFTAILEAEYVKTPLIKTYVEKRLASTDYPSIMQKKDS